MVACFPAIEEEDTRTENGEAAWLSAFSVSAWLLVTGVDSIEANDVSCTGVRKCSALQKHVNSSNNTMVIL